MRAGAGCVIIDAHNEVTMARGEGREQVAEPERPSGGNEPARSRLSMVLIVVLLILAVAGAILLFTVVKPDPNATATGVVKAVINDVRSGNNSAADKLRCANERRDRPGAAWVHEELGIPPSSITGVSVSDEGKVADSSGRTGTAVAATLRVKDGPATSVDFFVVRESDKLRVCGIGSLAPGSGR